MSDWDPNSQCKDRAVQNLQEFLVDTLAHVRSLHAAVTAMMADVAALRRTLLAEPEAFELYEKNLRAVMEMARPMVDEAIHSYDDMLGVLSVSDRWQN